MTTLTSNPQHGLQFSSVQSPSHVRLFATPWIAAHQASMSITNSLILIKLMSIESVMPSNHLILCHPLLLLPSILPSIRVFSNESVLRMRWPKHWSFSFSISPSKPTHDPNLYITTGKATSPTLARGFFTAEPSGKSDSVTHEHI